MDMKCARAKMRFSMLQWNIYLLLTNCNLVLCLKIKKSI
jgi:hypothetical protein